MRRSALLSQGEPGVISSARSARIAYLRGSADRPGSSALARHTEIPVGQERQRNVDQGDHRAHCRGSLAVQCPGIPMDDQLLERLKEAGGLILSGVND